MTYCMYNVICNAPANNNVFFGSDVDPRNINVMFHVQNNVSCGLDICFAALLILLIR